VSPLRPPEPAPALLTDLYELTMLQAYWREDLREEAVFSLFFRHLPDARNYVLACGLDDALRSLEHLRFGGPELEYLAGLGLFGEDFLAWLGDFRFGGDVFAVPEGTPVFADEPLLEVVAPLPEAQIAESIVMNRIHLQTVLATKASRVVTAAAGRRVVDFGMRRMHGSDAALAGARAFYVAGVDATSNVLAGFVYGIPVAGTMAHSYVQAHDCEADAFRDWVALYPKTVLLVDTYDTLAGVRDVAAMAGDLGAAFQVRGVRLDSGDLGALSRGARKILDAAGLEGVEIFASGNLDELRIAELVASGAPIAAFGVGTLMGVSRDEPFLDLAYKLTSYAGRGRLKTSTGKSSLPGRKQVFRMEEGGFAAGDVLACHGEEMEGRPLLVPVMRRGERLPAGDEPLDQVRQRAARELARLPAPLRGLEPVRPGYPVEISKALEELRDAVQREVTGSAD
jgi:nicotinate phosphoribosyltransferase